MEHSSRGLAATGNHRKHPKGNPVTDLFDPILLNFLYAVIGGLLTLFFMWLGCKVFSHIVNFSIPDELAKGNMAVGLMIMGIFIGIGTALGLVIGLGLN
ncbi:MAG: DUF350 domain-containing protein [Gammaproteobacteria bacterium]|nr:DUF350 domain-containing protein [Gammaproteobacteria bacterium]